VPAPRKAEAGPPHSRVSILHATPKREAGGVKVKVGSNDVSKGKAEAAAKKRLAVQEADKAQHERIAQHELGGAPATATATAAAAAAASPKKKKAKAPPSPASHAHATKIQAKHRQRAARREVAGRREAGTAATRHHPYPEAELPHPQQAREARKEHEGGIGQAEQKTNADSVEVIAHRFPLNVSP